MQLEAIIGQSLFLIALAAELLFLLFDRARKARLAGQPRMARSEGGPRQRPPELSEIVKYVILLSIVGVALYVIISPGADQDSKKWAYGAIGLVLGWLLKSK